MPQEFRLDGKVVLVTGGGRGLGRGMALALADAGASVMIAARTQEQLDRTVQEIRDAGGTAAAFRADVTDSAQVDAMVAACVAEFGGLDICFANAGIGGGTDAEFWEYPDWAFEDVMNVNLKSAFYTCRAAAKSMIERETGGVLVVVSSVAAYRASRRWDYGIAKGGVLAMMNTLSGILAPRGIRVNCITPGVVMQTDPADDRERAERAQRGTFFPVNRVGEWWEMGPLAVYLASDASRYVTGHDFLIDGGMVNAGIAPAAYAPHHEI